MHVNGSENSFARTGDVTPQQPAKLPTEFEDIVQAFEQALAREGRADIRYYLPPLTPAHLPQGGGEGWRGALLRELVRIDIEHAWSHGQPRRLGAYLRRFPELLLDREGLKEIAFEEFRLRRQAGEAIAAEEYRHTYGIEVGNWPNLPVAQPPAKNDSSPSYWTDSATPAQPWRLVNLQDPLIGDALSALPEVGSTFRDFRLKAELGRGAFGRVYLAEQGDLANRLVALKISVDLGGESQTLAQLQHTNIVPIYSTHRTGIFQAVCMPYFGSVTLADMIGHLRTRQTLPERGKDFVDVLDSKRLAPPAEVRPASIALLENRSYVDAVLWLMSQIAEGLAHAHERGILHRDLKPANILLTDDGQPMLVDFNLSADSKSSEDTASTNFGGTLPYMSPEHLQAFHAPPEPAGSAPPAAVDARSDLYALGVMMFELLTGRFPFPHRQGPLHQVLPSMIAERRQPAPLVRRWNRAISPAVQAIVRRLLHRDPEQRYQTAQQLRDDLQCQLQSAPLRHAGEPSLLERAAKWRRRHPRLTSPVTFAALLVIALIGSTALILRWNLQQSEQERIGVQRNLDDVRGRLTRLKLEEEKQQARLDEIEGKLANAKVSLAEARASITSAEKAAADARASFADEQKKRQEAVQENERLKDQASDSLRQFQKSIGLLRRHDEDIGAVQSLFDEESLQQEAFNQDVVRCRAALERYQVLENPNWQDSPHVKLLPERERTQLQQDIAELLYLLNRATLFEVVQAKQKLRPWQVVHVLVSPNPTAFLDVGRVGSYARIAEALRLNGVAFECYPYRRPRSLVMQRAELARLHGDQAAAEDFLARAERTEPQSVRDYYLTAYEYAALGRFREALTFARSACDQDRKQPGMWFLLGLCQARTGKPDKAEDCYDIALVLKPGWSAAHYHRARARLQRGDTPAALADFDDAVKYDPKSVELHLQRGLLLARLGSREAALKDVKACVYDPSPATAFRIGCIYAHTAQQVPQDRERALKHIALAINLGYDAAALASDERLTPLQTDPGFQQLLRAAASLRQHDQ